MPEKTDYLMYHRRYRELKKEGMTGWVDEDAPNFPIHLNALKRACRHRDFPKSGRALDLGCGAGCWSFQLERLGYDVTGLDLSPFAVEWAREKAAASGSDCQFVAADVLTYDGFEPASFDVILDGFLLHCLIGEDRHRYLAKAFSLLKPYGLFLVQSFCADNLDDPAWDRWHIDPVSRISYDEHGTAVKYVGTEESLKDDVKKTGFTVSDSFSIPIGGGMLLIACHKPGTRRPGTLTCQSPSEIGQ